MNKKKTTSIGNYKNSLIPIIDHIIWIESFIIPIEMFGGEGNGYDGSGGCETLFEILESFNTQS